MKNNSALKKMYIPFMTITFIVCCILSAIKAKEVGGITNKSKEFEGIIANTIFISQASAEAMRKKLDVLKNATADNASLGAGKSLREAVKETQDLLRKKAVKSSGFRITGDTAEFTIYCSPEAFFAILAESSLNIIYLNVKPEKDEPPEISIIMRIRDET